jgi:hypothetical protein
MAWEQSAEMTFLGTLRSTLWELAYALSCGPGMTPEECTAGKEEGALELKPIKRLLSLHMSWMTAHPAATCFRDGYAADRAVVASYSAWIANWGPWGGDVTSEGRAQIEALQAADAKADSFLSKINGYFSDCH